MSLSYISSRGRKEGNRKMTWDYNKHNCRLKDNLAEFQTVFIEDIGWFIQFEGVTEDIKFCPYCGKELEK